MGLLISHATHTLLARNESGHSVEQAWILRGISEGFAWVLRGILSFFLPCVSAKDINITLTVL